MALANVQEWAKPADDFKTKMPLVRFGEEVAQTQLNSAATDEVQFDTSTRMVRVQALDAAIYFILGAATAPTISGTGANGEYRLEAGTAEGFFVPPAYFLRIVAAAN